MNAKDVCEYVTELENNYSQASVVLQEALDIFQDILLDDKTVKGEGWRVPEDRINDWINSATGVLF